MEIDSSLKERLIGYIEHLQSELERGFRNSEEEYLEQMELDKEMLKKTT